MINVVGILRRRMASAMLATMSVKTGNAPSTSNYGNDQQHFLYFAYGSNLLTERIRLNNPTAVKMDVAKLQNYKLDFELYGERWGGAVATIQRQPDGHVWGVVWKLNRSELPNLDRQEIGYDPIEVMVESLNGNRCYLCRTYVLDASSAQFSEPTEYNDVSEVSNNEMSRRLPSVIYKQVIVKGAIENGLPDTYVQSLCSIEDNGYNGPVKVQLSFTRTAPLTI